MGGIYVHIPFCKTHCTYCAFYSELLRNAAQGSDCFVDALCREIASSAVKGADSAAGACASDRVVDTLYFGGGTPSLLSVQQLRRVVKAIGNRFDCSSLQEFTVEVNPDDIVKNGLDYAAGLRSMGVNRISMGLQSFDDAVLKRMGRRHSSAMAKEAYAVLRQAGFDNISIDLIFGFAPNLDLALIGDGLREMGLPRHISCYQLSIEEGSALEKMLERGFYEMPPDEECERQYYALCSLLSGLGYSHYEISNWALPGFHSRHNSSYWNHTPYTGFGPGAHSLFIGPEGEFVRRWNNPDIASYVSVSQKGEWEKVRDSEILTPEQIAEERLFLGLRTAEGVDGKRIPEDKWFISDSIIADML